MNAAGPENILEHTTDPNDPRLVHEADDSPVDAAPAYVVLPESERLKHLERPYRTAYLHSCGARSLFGRGVAETLARDRSFYQLAYCSGCRMHRPVAEFHWDDGPDKRQAEYTPGSKVGS